MGDSVAQKERQAPSVDFAVGVETVALQADGALREPIRPARLCLVELRDEHLV